MMAEKNHSDCWWQRPAGCRMVCRENKTCKGRLIYQLFAKARLKYRQDTSQLCCTACACFVLLTCSWCGHHAPSAQDRPKLTCEPQAGGLVPFVLAKPMKGFGMAYKADANSAARGLKPTSEAMPV
mmetsp:Transcript_138561/g.360081  ORF Transcript_138561/g.360081 Transcript_138561/m.360081 type:complete len:126 (+) Transcript_138561:163-540(+)